MSQDEGGEKPKKEKKERKNKKPKAELKDLTCKGTIIKKESKKGVKYLLKTEDGIVSLPKPGKKDKNPTDYSKFEDKQVTVVGKGYKKVKKTKKGEKVIIKFKKIDSITEGAAAKGEDKKEE